MQHTYLYPLPASARFLWMLGRAGADDLFGYPDGEHGAGIFTSLRLDEEFARARATVMRLIDSAPRVCIGEGYAIPNSRTEDGGKHHAVKPSTVYLTHLFWDAPVLDSELCKRVLSEFRAPEPGRDSFENVGDFLAAHMGQLIIPVRM